jgi:hypothetical protein
MNDELIPWPLLFHCWKSRYGMINEFDITNLQWSQPRSFHCNVRQQMTSFCSTFHRDFDVLGIKYGHVLNVCKLVLKSKTRFWMKNNCVGLTFNKKTLKKFISYLIYETQFIFILSNFQTLLFQNLDRKFVTSSIIFEIILFQLNFRFVCFVVNFFLEMSHYPDPFLCNQSNHGLPLCRHATPR